MCVNPYTNGHKPICMREPQIVRVGVQVLMGDLNTIGDLAPHNRAYPNSLTIRAPHHGQWCVRFSPTSLDKIATWWKIGMLNNCVGLV